jgi:hypothetical protein
MDSIFSGQLPNGFFFSSHFLDHVGLELGTVLLAGLLFHDVVYTLRADHILSEILGSL